MIFKQSLSLRLGEITNMLISLLYCHCLQVIMANKLQSLGLNLQADLADEDA